MHEGEHQKAQSRARFLARGRAPKSTILCTRESTKKHDLEHDFWHEGEHQKARSRARFFARGKHRKARFCARRKILKTTFAQNIKTSFFDCYQLLGRIQHIIYIMLFHTGVVTQGFLHWSSCIGVLHRSSYRVFSQEIFHRSSYTGVFAQEFLHRSFYTGVLIQEFSHRSSYTGVYTGVFFTRVLTQELSHRS